MNLVLLKTSLIKKVEDLVVDLHQLKGDNNTVKTASKQPKGKEEADQIIKVSSIN